MLSYGTHRSELFSNTIFGFTRFGPLVWGASDLPVTNPDFIMEKEQESGTGSYW